jgi:sporulation protein YlmC with PRC-barrel domain
MKNKNMGIVLLLTAMLLIIGIVAALVPLEKTITIKGIGHDKVITSDGQILHMQVHNITNETDIGSANEIPEKITITQIGPDKAMMSDRQSIKKITITADNVTHIGDYFIVHGNRP